MKEETRKTTMFEFLGPDSVFRVIYCQSYRDSAFLEPTFVRYEVVETTNDGALETTIANTLSESSGKRLLTWLERIQDAPK